MPLTEYQRALLEMSETMTVTEIADKLGKGHSTISITLTRARENLEQGEEEEEPTVEIGFPAVEKLQRELQEAKRRERAHKLRADEASQLLDDFHASRFQIPKQKPLKKTKGTYYRVAFGDTHGAFLDPQAWNAMLSDLEYIKPREIVHLGDVVDCGGFLAAHHTANYVAELDYTYADDLNAANQMWDRLQAVCPQANIHAIQGNHDLRVEKWCTTAALRNKADAEFLRKQLDPEYQMHLEKRGIRWYKRGVTYEGCEAVAGSLLLGRCYFTHPQQSSKHHAAKMVQKFGHNVVYGHTHRRDSFAGTDARGDEWGAWSPGCLCYSRKFWHHSEPMGHTQGYHLQLVQPDGSFLPINVPIINGKSYLSDFQL